MHRKKESFPRELSDFVAELATRNKPKTCRSMHSYLKNFCRWMSRKKLSVDKLHRDHMVQWFAFLKNKGFAPSTRGHYLLCVRQYLRWIHEKGLIETDPDDLIRSSDWPKLPTYLPRPLPPAADSALQARLQDSEDVLHHGLLLMRKTGMRVGELINLEYDCIRTDHNDQKFIKVPLGKLYNERLVPLDDFTAELIRNIQRRRPAPRRWLIEAENGVRPSYNKIRKALLSISEGIETPEPISTHRLRHTFATSLLNGGISLVVLMRLLGHKSIRMTLRYADVTQETLTKQYFEALNKYKHRYLTKLKCHLIQSDEFDPVTSLMEIILWLDDIVRSSNSQNRSALLLSRRLKRAMTHLVQIKDDTK